MADMTMRPRHTTASSSAIRKPMDMLGRRGTAGARQAQGARVARVGRGAKTGGAAWDGPAAVRAPFDAVVDQRQHLVIVVEVGRALQIHHARH